MIADLNVPGKVGSILNDTAIPDDDFFGANKGSTVPDRTLQSEFDISNDGCVGGDEVSGFKVGFGSGVVEFAEAGNKSIF